MRRLKKKFKFEASHKLQHYLGACNRLHGHSYSFEIEVYGPVATKGPNRGMTLDYHIIGDAGKEIIEQLDHYHLNDVLGESTTTAEFISKWIYDRIKPIVPYLWAVTVSETEATTCRYSPPEDNLWRAVIEFYGPSHTKIRRRKK